MDNFEWARGYTERFGVHWTNYTGEAIDRSYFQVFYSSCAGQLVRVILNFKFKFKII